MGDEDGGLGLAVGDEDGGLVLAAGGEDGCFRVADKFDSWFLVQRTNEILEAGKGRKRALVFFSYARGSILGSPRVIPALVKAFP